ncbi:MAG: hypothetical protein KDD36_11705 [Flavobacteriales bacterium]|nr:hypothetical protein [Flavobacteriales bacterium]
MDIELIFKTGAFIISLALLFKGIYEYARAQQWKKAELVSREVKEFLADFNVKRALVLLDWNANHLALDKDEMPGNTTMKFDDALIESALRTHKECQKFTHEEVIIKEIFDHFLDRLTMFENYIESGLINARDLKPYLNYWIRILADPRSDRKPASTRKKMWVYIDEYGFDKVRSLCGRFGYMKEK